jgi:hypothetical protein
VAELCSGGLPNGAVKIRCVLMVNEYPRLPAFNYNREFVLKLAV